MLLLAPLAFASDEPGVDDDRWAIGIAVAGGIDLPAVEPLESTRFLPGAVLIVPVRWFPRPGGGMRITFEAGGAVGSDTVFWTDAEENPPIDWYSSRHWAAYGAARLLAGPELVIAPRGNTTPYLGVNGGFAAVATFHSFDENTAVLSDAGTGGLDPYTQQVVPAASADLGIRAGRPGRLALEVELGYTLSFLPSAPLRQAPEALDATRSAYALDVVRVGFGVSLPL